MNIFNDYNKLDNKFPENEINDFYKRGFAEVKPTLTNFLKKTKEDPEMLLRRWSDIREMILNLDTRIHYWASRRIQFLQLTIAIIAASIVGLVAIIPKFPTSGILTNLQACLYIPIFISCIILFFGCIWLLIIWNMQNNPNYPFTKAYKTWRWHYRHAETIPLDTNIKYDKVRYREQINIFYENMIDYKKRTLQCEPIELLDQDLSQLYLLITNEKFKVKFVSILRDAFLKILGLSFFLGIIALVVILLLR